MIVAEEDQPAPRPKLPEKHMYVVRRVNPFNPVVEEIALECHKILVGEGGALICVNAVEDDMGVAIETQRIFFNVLDAEKIIDGKSYGKAIN